MGEEVPEKPPLVSMNTDVAACKLQATYRGHGDRKKVEEVKKEKDAATYEQRANEAAAEIQAAFALYETAPATADPAPEEVAAAPAAEEVRSAAPTGEVKFFEVRITPQENDRYPVQVTLVDLQ